MSASPYVASLPRRVVMPRLNRPDLWLLMATAGLIGLGVVMVFNATYFYAQERYADPYLFVRKQLMFVAVGALVLAVASRLRLEVFERLARPLLLASIVMLALLLIPGIGMKHGGARRWMCVGGGCLQPSEFVKTAVILFLASSIARKSAYVTEFRMGILPPLVVVGVCVFLVAAQPDFGTAVILMLSLLLMLYGGGARLTHLGAVVLAAFPVGFAALYLWPYRWMRILAFLDPWRYAQDIAFQLVQSLIAFGSGRLTGIGLGESRQKMFFLPEAHTDFIFALIGEELGLWGALLVLTLFGIIGQRGFRIASRHPDRFASLLAFGLTLVILLEAVVNVGVVMGLLPTKGLALPFLSYGGSALIGTLLQVGVLTALSRMTG